jgi:general secretion pathway protein E
MTEPTRHPVPIAYAREFQIVASRTESGHLEIAFPEGSERSLMAAEVVSRLAGDDFTPLPLPQAELQRQLAETCRQSVTTADEVIRLIEPDEASLEAVLHEAEDLLDDTHRSPVVRLINAILFQAATRNASDIHIQGSQTGPVVRLRIDGILHDVLHPPAQLQSELISRIKVMGGMNIAERRVPQDGRCSVTIGERTIDLRISTLPTSFGERAVVRLLDKTARLLSLNEIGMPNRMLQQFRTLIGRDHGILLVTGPTGSGKSTTLYGVLGELDSSQANILTLEDPIEYQLEGISQTQINEKKGMTFARGLRHVLRQDPDIIMIGEIRDAETARMAIQSALTGHLVLSTLHTNDAAGAVARLLDLGIEPYLVASSLLGVLAQRLVRTICKECGGKGCDECLQSGYQGRAGLFELLGISDAIRENITERTSAAVIKQQALAEGMTTLHDDGMTKVASGLTSKEEVARVTSAELGGE